MRAILVAVAALILAGCGGPNAAQREQLKATQAVVDERVRNGQMTPAEGQAAMANMRAQQDAERRRNYAIMTGGDGSAVYQPVGGGTVMKY